MMGSAYEKRFQSCSAPRKSKFTESTATFDFVAPPCLTLSIMTLQIRWLVCFVLAAATLAQAQDRPREQAQAKMRAAAEYFHQNVARHGGYVYHYSLDLKRRWGEGVAADSQIWIQPPGTPTVGMAFVKAYQATGDEYFLTAATDAAMAVVYGQLKSGGWTNSVDFDPDSKQTAEYRNGKGRGKNNSSLDDGQTQSAILFLVQVDRAHRFKNLPIHEAAMISLDALLKAQYPCGAFPQVWTEAVPPQPSTKANYPKYDWRTEGRIKNYWDMYTLNDNVTGYVADTLIEAHRVYEDQRYLDALKRLGDFLVLAQMPEPQPGWAQQYNYAMQPIWARKFEPPAVASDETQEVLRTLMKISEVTQDQRYLAPIPAAAAWLRRSLLPDGQFARYYELKTNRPLYMTRDGDNYSLTHDDQNLPDHYGWKIAANLAELSEQFARVKSGKPFAEPQTSELLAKQAQVVMASLDQQGRWVSKFDDQRLVGQFKLPIGTPYLSSQVFSDNLNTLSDFVAPQ
jgi:PelA/Pel-15E family pectate lyase